MTVPFTFANQTGNIALSQLDANFANVKAAADTAGTVTASAQPLITSVGQLTSLTVSGNIRTLSGGIFAPGYFYANGQPFLPGSTTGSYGNANVAAYLPTYNGAFDNLAGNVTTTAAINAAAGRFTGRIDAGTIVGAEFSTNGTIFASRTITGGNLTANGTVSGLTVQATGGGVTATGNITGLNLITTGNVIADRSVEATSITALGTIQGSDLYSTGILRGATLIVSGNSSMSGVATVLNDTDATSASQAALVVTGGLAVGKNSRFGGNLLPSVNASFDLGSAAAQFRTIYGVSTQAVYADLAENYVADGAYDPGTVLMFGGSHEVTLADPDTQAIAGVVSQNPAHLMNAGLFGPNIVPVALQGRVWCNVTGTVKKGDIVVSAGQGFARSNNEARIGQVIGKALQDFSGGQGQIEVVVGRT